MSEILDEFNRRRAATEQKRAQVLAQAQSGVSPDAAAAQAQTARRYNVSPDVASTIPDDSHVREAQAAATRAPRVGEWVGGSANRAALARGGMGNLADTSEHFEKNTPARSFLDRTLELMRSASPIALGVSEVPSAVRAAQRGFEDVSLEDIDSAIGAGAHRMVGGIIGAAEAINDTPSIRVWGNGASPSQQALRRTRQSFESFADKLSPETETEEGAGIISAIESAPTMLISMAGGAYFKSAGVAASLMGVTTGGTSYGRAVDAGLSPEQALLYGAIDAVIEGGTELIPFAKFLPSGTGGFTGRMLQGAGADVLGEQVATFTQDLNAWAQIEQNEGKTFQEFLDERGSAAYQTLVASLVTSGSLAAVTAPFEIAAAKQGRLAAQAAQADPAEDFLRTLGELSKASAVLQRDPASFEEFVAGAADETGGPTEVFIEAAELKTVLDQSDLTVEQVFEMTGMTPEALAAAVARGADVSIPVGEYASKIAAQPISEQLMPHLRLDPDAMSRKQAETYLQSAQEELERDVELEMAKAEAGGERAASRAKVEEQVLSELSGARRFTEDVNRVYASIVGAFFDAQGAKVGMTAEQLAERYGLKVQSGEVAAPSFDQNPELEGLPANSRGGFAPAQDAAQAYMTQRGEAYNPPTVFNRVDPERAARIAQAYEEMADAPNDPQVREAYDAMVEETLAQYETIKATGLQIEFVEGEDPYGGNPWGAVDDVRENNHLWVFSTEDGYGREGITPEQRAGNPMLQVVEGESWSGKPVLVNDVFRVVHDYFGHIKSGVGFRADGEENAWRMHSAMYSPLARRAMTSETRGQNSWLNYGPHGENNRNAKIGDTVFAEQKIGLMPEWTSTEGALDVVFEQSAAPLQELPMRVRPSGPGGRVLNKDLGEALTLRHRAEFARPLDPTSPEDYAVALASMIEDYDDQSAQPDTGETWYSDDVAEAIRITEHILPEIADPVRRDIFMTAVALLSPQQGPVDNWSNAIEAMRGYSVTGRFALRKDTGANFGVASHASGLRLFQHLIDTYGEIGALVWLNDEHTGREMEAVRRASGIFKNKADKYLPAETNLTESKLGVYIFGPKVGDFMLNSTGLDQSAVTVDLWMARTYNRIIGRLMDVNERTAAEGGLADAMRGRAERAIVKRLVRDAAEQVGIAPSAMQAALWYFEQRLYRNHGIQSDSTSFSDAARLAAEKFGVVDGAVAQGSAAGSGATQGSDLEEGVRVYYQSGLNPLDEFKRESLYPTRAARHEDDTVYADIADFYPDRQARIAEQLGAKAVVAVPANDKRLAQGVPLWHSAPPIEPDGTIRLDHWGPAGIAQTDPSRWGESGTQGTSERGAITSSLPRTFFGIASGQPGGYIVEFPGRTQYQANVPAEKLYDVARDPDKLKPTDDVAALERKIKAAGYLGYWTADPQIGLVATVFEPLEVQVARPMVYAQDAVFYSALERAIERSPTTKAPAQQWINTLKKTPGIKEEELGWTGLLDFLEMFEEATLSMGAPVELLGDGQWAVTFGPESMVAIFADREEALAFARQHRTPVKGGDTITRERMLEVVRAGGVRVDEVVLGEPGETEIYFPSSGERATVNRGREYIPTKFAGWSSDPQNDTYRELLITLPVGEMRGVDRAPSTHWDTEGVIAHVRFMDKVDADGNRVLFIEEVQSDWHQKGRDQGYEGVVDAEQLRAANNAYDDAIRALNSVLDRVIAAPNFALMYSQTSETVRRSGSVHGHLGNEYAVAQRIITGDIGSADVVRQSLGADEFLSIREAYNAASLRITETGSAQRNARGARGIPNAPFKTSWPALVMKRVIRYAAEHGYDKIAWTTGEQQAERYNLSQAVGSLDVAVDDTPVGRSIEEQGGERSYRVVFGNDRAARVVAENVSVGVSDDGRDSLRMTYGALVEAFGSDLAKRISTEADAGFQTRNARKGATVAAFDEAEAARQRQQEAQDQLRTDAIKAMADKAVRVLGRDRAQAHRDALDNAKDMTEFDLADELPDGVERLKEIRRLQNERANLAGRATRTRMMSDFDATFQGEDLRVGGEGMKQFYDRNLVNITNGLIKKYGAKVGEVNIQTREQEGRLQGQLQMLRLTEAGIRDDEALAAIDPVAERRLQSEFIADGGYRARDSLKEEIAALEAGTPQPGFDITPELADAAMGGFPLFQRERGPRGQIAFGADITQAPSVITLLRGADLSTFVHELGHFFFEVTNHMASRAGAPAEIVADRDAMLRYLGVASATEWEQRSPSQRRDGHERMARSFEAYLFEGNAPSVELEGVFAKLRSWMMQVYRTITRLNVELTDEVRGVFDRMLASEEAIAEAQADAEMRPLFTEKPEGMSEEDWASYQRLDADATGEAEHQLEGKSLRDMQFDSKAQARELKRLQRENRDQRDAMRDEVRAELRELPVYKASDFLRRGMVNGEQVEGEHRMSTEQTRAELLRITGDDKIPTEFALMTKKGGIPPQQVSEMFGFTSVDHLFKEIILAPSFGDAVEAETDARMRERYGELNTAEEVEQAAKAAAHNELRGRVIASELATLQNAPGKKRVLASAAQRVARGMIARLRIRDLRPGKYEAAERRAAKAAYTLGADTPDQAIVHKRNQLLQFNLARAAHEARDETQKARDYLTKFNNKNTRANIDPDFLEQIDQLLEKYELRPVSNRESDRRKSLAKWVEEMQAQGFEPTIDPTILDQLQRKPWRELTVEEMRGLLDAVRNIEHLGRLTKKLLTARDKADLDTAAGEMGEAVRVNARRSVELPVGAKTWWENVKSGVADYLAMHRKLANLAYVFDGNAYGGVFWERFIRPMNERGDWQAVRNRKAGEELAALFRGVSKENTSKREFVPEVGTSLSLEDRLMIALNMGNEANLQRLMSGERWEYEQVQAVVARLEAHHWDFVESVWAYIDSYWPEIAAKERRISGVEPEKVEALPFQVEVDGQLRLIPGGYFPIKYDADKSSKADADEASEVLRQMTRGLYTNAQTRRGHTKERVAEVNNRPLRKDFGVVFSHVNQVIHDLAWHEYLIDANRLLKHGSVDSAIREHYGPETLRWMRKGLEDIAIGDITAQNAFEKSIRHLRAGVSISAMGWSLWTSLLQPTGLTQSVARIGAKHVLLGIGDLFSNPAKMNAKLDWVREVSPFMRERGNTMQREINEIRNRIGTRSPMRKIAEKLVPEAAANMVTDSYFYMIMKAQLVADLPTWLGQYRKSMDAGEQHDRAVAIADQAVIDSQGAGQIKDLAGVQRGSELMKLFTNFYSYFSATMNLMTDRTTQMRRVGARDLPYYAIDMALLSFVPATIASLMYNLLKGDGDDEPEEIAEQVAQDNLVYMLGLFIGVREIGSALAGIAGYQGPAGARFFAETGRFGKQVSQGEIDEPLLRATNSMSGILLHYPSTQLDRTARGTIQFSQGDAGPEAVAFGPPRGQ